MQCPNLGQKIDFFFIKIILNELHKNKDKINKQMSNFSIVIAIDSQGLMGSLRTPIPWNIRCDLEHFIEITKSPDNNSVILMGRKTADTFKSPLDGRINHVITSIPGYRREENFVSSKNLDDALLNYEFTGNKLYVIGGPKLLKTAVRHVKCVKIFLTKIGNEYCQGDQKENIYIGDEVSDEIKKSFVLTKERNEKCYCFIANRLVDISFKEYTYLNREEAKYLDLMSEIIQTGHYDEWRNGYTYSLFGKSLEFDLSNGLPVLTTKKIFIRGIIEELLFFLKGQTNSKILEDKGIKIWHDNTTRDFLDSVALNYDEYDMGPMYGFQWRHFGAQYLGMDHDYTGEGIDQFSELIDQLVNNPKSRRILLTTYNPMQVKEGCLYPCHGLMVQFNVCCGKIDLMMNQRSGDYFLGVPFNITSYAILLHIVVNLVNNDKNRKHEEDYIPGKIVLVFGNVHLYKEHVSQAYLQLMRKMKTKRFPFFAMKKISTLDEMENLIYDDFVIRDYVCCPGIKAQMIP
jgi:dihydrofolate reductase / thymidylate synthase